MKDATKEKVAAELYLVWARTMGDEKPFPWEDVDAGERQAWVGVTEKAVELIGSRGPVDALARRLFRLWSAILGQGHSLDLVIGPRKGGGFRLRRYDEHEWLAEGDTVQAAMTAGVAVLEKRIEESLSVLVKEEERIRAVLEGKKAP